MLDKIKEIRNFFKVGWKVKLIWIGVVFVTALIGAIINYMVPRAVAVTLGFLLIVAAVVFGIFFSSHSPASIGICISIALGAVIGLIIPPFE